jgi:hypothetical protein
MPLGRGWNIKSKATNTFGLDRLYHSYMIASSTGSGTEIKRGNLPVKRPRTEKKKQGN